MKIHGLHTSLYYFNLGKLQTTYPVTISLTLYKHFRAEDRSFIMFTFLCSPSQQLNNVQLFLPFSFLFWPEKLPLLEKHLAKDLSRLECSWKNTNFLQTFPRINTLVKYS